jgi:hypothetical protein
MSSRRLLALAHNGVARAECDADGQWSVERVLSSQDVRCLDVDPLRVASHWRAAKRRLQ